MKVITKYKSTQVFGITLLVCSFMVLLFLWRQEHKQNDFLRNSLAVGQKAPAFSISQTDGSLFQVEKEKGHPVLLEFWATWCQACIQSLPKLESLERSKQITPWSQLRILAIEIEGEQKKEQLMEKQKEFHFLIALGNQEIARLYPSASIPFLVLLDSKGMIQNTWHGFPSEKVLKQALSQAE